ncbi:MAG: hypothetical protein AABX24_00780 [Nanoarchaeota archaeon]
MIDTQKAAYEMKAAEQRIKNNFIELGTLDYRRAEHFYDYFKHNQQEDLDRFLKETITSKAPLQSIRKDFRKILVCMLSLDKKLHKHPSFKNLLKRARNMENLLCTFFKHRKTQIKACRYLLHANTIQNQFLKGCYELYNGVILKAQEKRLILSFGNERDLVAMFEGYFKQEKERIDAAFQAYLNEKNKALPVKDASLTIVVLAPVVGAALALAMHAAFEWANKSGFNHKLLVKPSTTGGRNGSAV